MRKLLVSTVGIVMLGGAAVWNSGAETNSVAPAQIVITHLVGVWTNGETSVLTISTVDGSSGAIEGEGRTSSVTV